MEAQSVSIKSFMMADASIFNIPFFQRSYAWNADNINVLMDDVKEVFDGKKKVLFLGNIIVSTKKHTNNFEIIDGQQRTITMFLMTLAARNILIDIGTVYSTWAANLIDEYLSSISYDNGVKKRDIKIVAKNKDEASLHKLFSSEGREDNALKDDRINNNYLLIKTRLWEIYKEINDPTNFFDAFFEVFTKGIQIVEIIIFDTDHINPQEVFETFNGTGVKLTSFDLIRNYMLMGADKKEQEQLWKQWDVFESKIDKKYKDNEDKIDKFLNEYLKKNLKHYDAKEDTYKNFKLLVQQKKSKLDVLNDIEKEV